MMNGVETVAADLNGAAKPAPPMRALTEPEAAAAHLLATAIEDGDTRPAEVLLDLLDGPASALAPTREEERLDLWAKRWGQTLEPLRARAATGDREAARELRSAIRETRTLMGIAAPPPLPSPAEHTLALLGAPPDIHVRTGIETLDEITGGGFLSGKLIVIAGEPNVGKTSLATQCSWSAVEEGFVVGFHVADVDDRRGIILRIAQAHGIDRRKFLRHDEAALAKTASILRNRPLFSIVDEAADDRSVEETAEALLALAAATSRRAVLVVDSLQTVRLRWKEEPRTDKDRIDKVVRALVAYTRRGLLVVATCEVPRAVYSGPKKTKRPTPAPPALAAFKGSGNIEYALWTGLVLTRIRGETDAVRVEVPKNKQGREDVTFKLLRTESRVGYEDAGEMHEGGAAKDDAEDSEERAVAAQDAKIERSAAKLVPILVRKLVEAGAVGLSARQARQRLVGKNLAKDRAIEMAVAQGAAVARETRGYDRFYAPSCAPPLDDTPAATV